MTQLLNNLLKKIILIIVLVSLLISFCATPYTYATESGDDDFYYTGVQEGSYTITKIDLDWLLNAIGDIADWILGIIPTMFRMSIVGWTALIEKWLTRALESASGVSASGEVIESNTDLTALTDSSNNVTIEAIVYNHVASLDANIFNYTGTIDDLKYSATGQLLKCEADECNTEANSDVTSCCSEDGTCSCSCGGECEGCSTYIEAVNNYNERQKSGGTEPIITQIKKSVATWYYIIRMLAIAAMLIALIITGIKMAIATTADQKASYKKMLIDWLVGAIILFSMHYIISVVFLINESLIGVIESTSDSINAAAMSQLSDDEQYSSSEIEIKVYENVRTRAYDAKLINGLIGMIMYITLVYFAFRYTIVYIKRLFTIIVLVIMAPGVGVAYALQKVLTNKQMALKNWLNEFILNVMIQLVHALIYAIFISQALILSLDSVEGVVFAFILMNFSLKADSLFRKIFKMSTGMVENTQNATENLRKNLTSAYVGGKAAVRTLTNTPYANAVKNVGKATAALPVLMAAETVGIGKGIGKKVKDISESFNSDNNENEDYEESQQFEKTRRRRRESTSTSIGKAKAERRPTRKNGLLYKKSDEQLLNMGNEKLLENLRITEQNLKNAKTNEEYKEALREHQIASSDYSRFKKLTDPSELDKVVSHGKKALSFKGNFNLSSKYTIKQNLKNLYKGIYGNSYKDVITGKRINDGSGYYNQFKPKNLLGMSEEDKKGLAKIAGLAFSPVAGFASVTLGMGLIVANPKIGLGLLASGTSMMHNSLGLSKHIRRYSGKTYYNNLGFRAGAKRNISKSALKKAKKEYNNFVVENIKINHPNLYKGLKFGTVAAATITLMSGSLVPATLIGAGFIACKLKPTILNNTKLGDAYYDFNQDFAKREKEQEREFRKETRDMLKLDMLSIISSAYDREKSEHGKNDEEFKIEVYKRLGYKYNPETGTLTLLGEQSEDEKIREELENQLEQATKDIDTEEEELTSSALSNGHKLTDADSKYIHEEIDNIIAKMASGDKVDINSQSFLNTAMKKLTDKLILQGIITDSQTADAVFKRGKAGLEREIKNKGSVSNIKIEIAEQAMEGIDEEDREEIKEIVKETIEKNNISDYKQINVEDIVKELENKKKEKQATDSDNYQYSTDSQNQGESQSQSGMQSPIGEGEQKGTQNPFGTQGSNGVGEQNGIQNPIGAQGSNGVREQKGTQNLNGAKGSNGVGSQNGSQGSDGVENQNGMQSPIGAQSQNRIQNQYRGQTSRLFSKSSSKREKKYSQPDTQETNPVAIDELTDNQKSDYTKRIGNFLAVLEATKTAGNNPQYEKKKRIQQEVESKVKKRRRKLEQVLELSLDPDFDVDNMITQVSNEKKNNSDVDNAIENSSKVLEVLFAMKGLEELNEFDMTQKELEKGSPKYLSQRRIESSAKLDYDRAQLEIKRYEQKSSKIYGDENYENRKYIYTDEEIEERKKIDELKNIELKKLKSKWETEKRKTRLVGPIVDRNAEIKRILKRR